MTINRNHTQVEACIIPLCFSKLLCSCRQKIVPSWCCTIYPQTTQQKYKLATFGQLITSGKKTKVIRYTINMAAATSQALFCKQRNTASLIFLYWGYLNKVLQVWWWMRLCMRLCICMCLEQQRQSKWLSTETHLQIVLVKKIKYQCLLVKHNILSFEINQKYITV